MKKLGLILLTLAIALPSGAQRSIFDVAEIEDPVKPWSSGPLTMDDFMARNGNDVDGLSSGLDWKIVADDVEHKSGNLKFSSVQTSLGMNRITSWFNPEEQNPYFLRYHQTCFDIVELERRRMQNAINANDGNFDGRQWGEMINSKVCTYLQETEFGKDTAAIALYEKMVKEQLQSIEETEVSVPAPFERGFGSSYYIGYGTEFSGDQIKAVTGMRNYFLMGFDVFFRRVALEIGMGLGRTGICVGEGFYHDPKYDEDWHSDTKCHGGNTYIIAGYKLMDRPYFSLTPMAGIGVGFIDQYLDGKAANGSRANSELNGFRLQAGFNLCYKISRSQTAASYTETDLALKLYAARTDYEVFGPVYSINLGLALDLAAWLRKSPR